MIYLSTNPMFTFKLLSFYSKEIWKKKKLNVSIKKMGKLMGNMGKLKYQL